jgi:glycosyltransferase involved in cell wall biosynthesis
MRYAGDPDPTDRDAMIKDGRKESPIVSVITVVLNGRATLERTIQSVLDQTEPRIEYIIIDGDSTDGSIDLIRRHADRVAFWQSAPDGGISEAFNRGLEQATGAYVALVNADDWLSPDQIARAVARLEGEAAAGNSAGMVFGDLVYHEPDGKVSHVIRGDPDYARSLRHAMPDVNHPTMVVRRDVYLKVGGFDPAFRVAMDYDWLQRVHAAGYRAVYEPGVVGHMTLAGRSDRRFVRGLAEVRKIAIAHGLPRPVAWLLFVYRIIKGMMQRLLASLIPARLHARLRALVNRGYRPWTPDAAE